MNLDYLVGRKATSVVVPLKEDEWKWAILFDDGTRLTYKGTEKRPNNVIEGTVLGTVDNSDAGSELTFYSGNPAESVGSVIGATEEFEIEWSEGSVTGQMHQEVDPIEDLPDDPSPERVAEGPEEPQEAVSEPSTVETGKDAPVETESLTSPENDE